MYVTEKWEEERCMCLWCFSPVKISEKGAKYCEKNTNINIAHIFTLTNYNHVITDFKTKVMFRNTSEQKNEKQQTKVKGKRGTGNKKINSQTRTQLIRLLNVIVTNFTSAERYSPI